MLLEKFEPRKLKKNHLYCMNFQLIESFIVINAFKKNHICFYSLWFLKLKKISDSLKIST